MAKRSWEAPERNKQAIFAVLARVLPESGCVLELGSGSGQHVVHFAAQLPSLSFQPSDMDTANLASIRAWVAEAGLANLRPPLELDVRAADWGVGVVEALFNANMILLRSTLFKRCWACFERSALASSGRCDPLTVPPPTGAKAKSCSSAGRDDAPWST